MREGRRGPPLAGLALQAEDELAAGSVPGEGAPMPAIAAASGRPGDAACGEPASDGAAMAGAARPPAGTPSP